MALEQKDKELAAIGASIGALCRPCIEHHIPAGRDAGLTEPELAQAVEVAEATQRDATDLLLRRSRELLRGGEAPAGAAVGVEPVSRLGELVAPGREHRGQLPPAAGTARGRGAAAGTGSRPGALAIKMAQIVQQHAADVTAGKAAAAIEAAERHPAAAP